MNENKHTNPSKKRKWSCSTADCEKNLHCFLRKRVKSAIKPGSCIYCGVELVDWDRIKKRDLSDVDFTFTSLKYEWVRHYFWHISFDERALNHARRKGKLKLKEAAEHRIMVSVGKDRNSNTWDGRQTPFEGNTLYYAQHATATCCRNCINRWHGIPKDRDLTKKEVGYLTKLVTLYIDERLSQLKDTGEIVSPIRRKTN